MYHDEFEFITNVFHKLRLSDFELGIGELLAAFKAIEGGWGDDLATMLKLLWCKSQVDRMIFEDILETDLPTIEQPDNTDQKTNISDDLDEDSPQSQDTDKIYDVLENEKTVANKSQLGDLVPIPVQPRNKIKLEKLKTYWPIPSNKMVYSWRYLRHPLPNTRKKLLDIQRTITETACRGFYLRPSYQREQSNYAHLILLIDQEGSMMPFHPFTRDIIKTAKESTIQVEVYYFHNIPTTYLYKTSNLLEPVEITEILKKFSKDTNILIISDAGAARGSRQDERITNTVLFLSQLENYNTVWLNPMPKSRWINTSANIIAPIVPMFEINPSGFHNAINFLQASF